MADAMDRAQARMAEQREDDQAEFLQDSCWVYSCLCMGFGLANPFPCAYGSVKVCCCTQETTTGAECMGDGGCCSSMQKCLCCVQFSEFPPDPVLIGCCNIFCVGSIPDGDELEAKGMSVHQVEQMAFLHDSFWLYYCCCFGYGCHGCGDPLIKGKSKCFCCISDFETANPFDEFGYCYKYSKCCCCKEYGQCLPRSDHTPGVGLCGLICCLQNFGDEPANEDGLSKTARKMALNAMRKEYVDNEGPAVGDLLASGDLCKEDLDKIQEHMDDWEARLTAARDEGGDVDEVLHDIKEEMKELY